jgi:RNA polymerase sigma-70 factor, ECF subfamily
VDEEALMQAYVRGDGTACERLFRTLAPSLRAFFLRSVGSVPDAEDLMQTTLLRIHRARDRFSPGQRLRPWVFTIAARVRSDWYRRKGRRIEDPLDAEGAEQVAGEGDLEHRFTDGERAERVRAAVDGLNEPQRIVVHLHRFEGLTFAEIGRVLGVSEGAAKLRAFRAYERLREVLFDLVAEGSP